MTVRAIAVLLALLAANCGGDVSFCTDPDPVEPPNCEVCDNNRDDDLDGEIDCDDELCEDAAVCRDERDETSDAPISSTSTTVPGP